MESLLTELCPKFTTSGGAGNGVGVGFIVAAGVGANVGVGVGVFVGVGEGVKVGSGVAVNLGGDIRAGTEEGTRGVCFLVVPSFKHDDRNRNRVRVFKAANIFFISNSGKIKILILSSVSLNYRFAKRGRINCQERLRTY